MTAQLFTEGVKPGGLTSGTEIRILLCYILNNVTLPVSRKQLEDVLLGEELANYFAMADSMAQLMDQGLVTHSNPSNAAKRFSASMARTPEGTEVAKPTQLTEPFCVPCTPAPLITNRQRWLEAVELSLSQSQ